MLLLLYVIRTYTERENTHDRDVTTFNECNTDKLGKNSRKRKKKFDKRKSFLKKNTKIMDRKNKPDLPDCYRKLSVTSQNKKCF